jgi:hypothetical protein
MLCDDCKNDGICKYTDDAKMMQKQAIEIAPNSIVCPIKIKMECARFEKKGQKQDGLCDTTFTKRGAL